MSDLEIPAPFEQDGCQNIVMCRVCGMESYAGQFFGKKLKGIYILPPLYAHLREIIRAARRYGVDAMDMICPRCGAKPDVTTGNKIINLMAGSSAWPITL